MRPVRLAIAQMNPVVGDFKGNTGKIISWIRKAEKKGAAMIVFPELALSGYPVWDLANKQSFLTAGFEALKKILKVTEKSKVTVVLGFIDHPELAQAAGLKTCAVSARRNFSSQSFNALAWIEKGKIKQVQHKRLLPNYDVFLEEIFFRPGSASRTIAWGKHKIAPTICEDIWDANYAEKPLAELARAGATLAVNVSASPYYRGVSEVRDALIKGQCARYKIPMLYVNQTGAQDDLIFDGRSLFVDGEGKVLFRAPAFEEDLYFYDWSSGAQSAEFSVDASSNQSAEMYEALCLGIRDYFRKNGFKKAILGLSGGIDSALVAALAVDALGADALCAVTMPGSYSSKGSWKDSEDLARNLDIELRNHPIREKYEFMVKKYNEHLVKEGGKAPAKGKVTLAMENLQARLRGMELMYLSNDEGRLLLSTGNKSEMAMGYCTLYGDMAGGLAVLGDVYKTDVYRLCRYRNRDKEVIPRAILDKPPSAELRPDQKDEDSLPPYEVLDEILFLYIEKNLSVKEICAAVKGQGISSRVVGDVIRKVDHNEYKRRQTPPILRVTAKAWFGRRMPITNRFDNKA